MTRTNPKAIFSTLQDSMRQVLPMWPVYERPRDYPNSYVSRRFNVTGKGAIPTADVIVGPTVESVREQLRMRGLTRLPRSQGDDPVIVETWL